MANLVVLPTTFSLRNLEILNIDIMCKELKYVGYSNALVIFDALVSEGRPYNQRQPFFQARPKYIKESFWPKWTKLRERRKNDFDAAALAVLTAYVKNGGLFEVDLDTL